MELFILWLLLAVAVGVLASNRGRNGFGWFLFSMLLSPLLGVIFLLVSKDLKKDDGVRVPCPACSEKVLITASICPHCRSEISNNTEFIGEVDAAKRKPREDSINLLIGVGVVVGVIVLAKIIDSI